MISFLWTCGVVSSNISTPSVKPVYGARYPPLQHDIPIGSPTKDLAKTKTFQDYENSVSDAWDTRVLVDDALASASAARVLAAHAAGKTREEVRIVKSRKIPYLKKTLLRVHQRFWFSAHEHLYFICINSLQSPQARPDFAEKGQKYPTAPKILRSLLIHAFYAILVDPIPTSVPAPPLTANPIYPKLPEISGDQVRSTVSAVKLSSQEGERDQTRFERLRRLFSVGKSNGRNSPPADIDMEQLRKDCWMGIPHKLRPQAWRLLSVRLWVLFLSKSFIYTFSLFCALHPTLY
ncbi:unnamed protein product [Cylicostephanus goldi]|uniref:Rab-GAP TBC domain-containing protein n=1 Tax=Cylicostephanus goldi TaxID=71465 RepID=A0A3P7M4H2_CYLGO|nr:unnamed protein product [Cylicostephanus goldi]